MAANVGSVSAQSEAQVLYKLRRQRVDDAIALRVPDRVPVAYFATFWQATYAGMTFREQMYNYDRLSEVTKAIVLELQPDVVVPPHYLTSIGPTLDLLGYRQLAWPGHGVAENKSYQYIDREYMKAEEYDDFINDPTWFILTRLLPRIADAYVPFAKLPQFSAAQHIRLVLLARVFADPELQAAFAQLAKAGEEVQRVTQCITAFQDEIRALGFPLGQAYGCPAPYDYFADYLRGSKGIMLDLYRRPGKLLEAMDRITPVLINNVVQVVKNNPWSKIVFMPLHWGLDGFMSPAQFKTFYWPQLQRVLVGLIEGGCIPTVLWEGDCTSRLEIIGDIPRGKAVYWFERTSLKLAKRVLGDVVCLRGNVPSSMLNTGTPDDVRAFCRDLIKVVGKGGGFILDGVTGIPDEAKPENVRAMFRSVHEYRTE